MDAGKDVDVGKEADEDARSAEEAHVWIGAVKESCNGRDGGGSGDTRDDAPSADAGIERESGWEVEDEDEDRSA